MKTRLLFLLLVAGFIQNAFAYPIQPRPLRLMIEEAEFIVHAKVIDVEYTDGQDFWHNVKAILEVKEVIQGKISKEKIAVYFNPSLSCPSPARYEIGTDVMAFLDKKVNGYKTHALSYGTKQLSASAMQVYKERIREFQAISSIENEAENAEKTIDWLVTCAIHSDTRWEGVHDLLNRNGFMTTYDEKEKEYNQKYELNKTQSAKIRAALLAIKKVCYTDLRLIDLFDATGDQEIIDFLCEQLKTSDHEKHWTSTALISRIADLAHRDDLKEINTKIKNLPYSDKNKTKKTVKLINEFIEIL